MNAEHSTCALETDRGLKLRTHKIRIEVIRGPQAGLITEIIGPEAKIGSSKDCDLVLNDPTVSRLHVLLRIEEDVLRVLDARSRNGTTLDGVRVRDAYARPDSSIGLGASTLRLRMIREVVELPLSSRSRLGGLVGASVAIRRVFTLIERIAPLETTVLIEGETGTGKELAAAAIHKESTRSKGQFVVFDCSSVAAGVIESELFGHERGAFTGATSCRVGRFEAAHGGTLFLDEIGELPLELQPKLLRAIETRMITRMGSNAARRVDVRIVAATNRALASEVERGRFREDLYYRLAVVPLRLPPLRERVDDIPLLVRHFEDEWRQSGRAAVPLADDAIAWMKREAWPGNLRELRNRVDMMLSLGLSAASEVSSSQCEGEVVPARMEVDLGVPLPVGLAFIEETYKRAYVELALRETGYNVSRAARLAGVGRAFVQKLMRKYGIRRGDGACEPEEGQDEPRSGAQSARHDRSPDPNARPGLAGPGPRVANG